MNFICACGILNNERAPSVNRRHEAILLYSFEKRGACVNEKLCFAMKCGVLRAEYTSDASLLVMIND